MWIKLLKEHSGHPVGTLIEVDDAIGKAYVEAKVAADAGIGPNKAVEVLGLDALQASLKGYTDSVSDAFEKAVADMQKSAQDRRPRIEPGPSEADKTRSMSDFVNQIVAAGDVRNLEECRAAQERMTKVYKSRYGKAVTKGQEESSGASGGFWTIPVEYEKQILMEQAEDAVILPGVTKVPLGARAKEWPALDQYRAPALGQSAMFGGIVVARKGEKSQRETQAIATKVKLEANDLTAYTEFSRDDQQDSEGVVESMLTKLIGGAIGFRRDWEHMWADGQGQAQGYIGCDAMLYVNRASDAAVISWDDIAAMLKVLMPSAQKRAVFVAHPYLQEAFLKLQDPAGHYIYIPSFPGQLIGAAAVNPPPMLANVPVLYTEKAGQPGSLGDLTLVDRAAILSGMRGGVELGLSEHFLFDTDQIALRCKVRDDAQPWLKKPIFLADGSGTNKVSAFVGLRNHAGTA